MKASPKSTWNPDRLDARAFAQAGAQLSQETPIAQLSRLRDEAVGDEASPLGSVRWQADGEVRAGAAGAAPSPWMHLSANTTLPLTCQRCLGPVEVSLEVDRWFRFVADEATAEAQDEDCEEDLLALEPRPSLYEVLEDELLMALPLVPLHDTCPVPVVLQSGDPAVDAAPQERPNPFAALERLKK